MNYEDFEARVRAGLRELGRNEVVRFAGICALRALPFLGKEGHFDYWDKKDRQKHLYAVFYAIDCNLSATGSAATVATAHATAAVAYAIAAYDDDADTTDTYAYIYATAYAAAYDDDANVTYASVVASYATDAVAYVADADAAAIFRNILLQDIENFKKGIPLSHTDTKIYGEVWDNFQKALENEGCAYWGRLYSQLFADGFVPNREALALRMSVTPEKRSEGARAVAIELEMMEKKGAARLSEARIIILGDKGAGKTCIARRLRNPEAPMTTPQESTPGVDTLLWKLKQEGINVRIWDFAGHTVTHAAHRFFLSERSIYIVVYNGRTDEPDKLYYWLNHVKNYGGDSPVFILVNQFDPHPVHIPFNTLKEKYPSIAGDKEYAFSIDKDKEALETFRKAVAAHIANHPSWNKQQIPAPHFKVKEALEERFKDKGEDRIDLDEFNRIAQENKVEKTDALLKDLHNLGVGLWYKHIEACRTVVLNPEWISYGIYKVINRLNSRKEYSILLTDFKDVFAGNTRYPEEQHLFFFELMQSYELAYKSPHRDEQRLIVPHLMPIDQPKELPEFPVGESLALRYKAEQPLPPDTVPRFIVRHHKDIKVAWRYGAVLADRQGNKALVKEDDRTISISIKGKSNELAAAYLNELRKTLSEIFEGYKSDKPELQYKIIEYGEKTNELFLPEALIDYLVKTGGSYPDHQTKRPVDVQQTYNIYFNQGDHSAVGPGSRVEDYSTHTTFNFRNCNMTLQGSLNELADSLTKNGNKEEAIDLKEAGEALREIENETQPEEVRRSGALNKLKRIMQDLGDEDSALHKIVNGVRNGIKIAKDIAKAYNGIAQWIGLPQVPGI
jgi:hypothetical protein